MTAHPVDLKDQATATAIERCLSFLLDAKARERIVLAHETGWITGDDALALLVTLDLIELPQVAE